jgi:hypothetical protein
MYKIITVGIITLMSFLVLATDVPSKEDKSRATKTEKRQKKVSMCPTCGKPEVKCDCPGEKKDEHLDKKKQ